MRHGTKNTFALIPLLLSSLRLFECAPKKIGVRSLFRPAAQVNVRGVTRWRLLGALNLGFLCGAYGRISGAVFFSRAVFSFLGTH